MARLAPARYVALNHVDWTNWDVHSFPDFAESIARVVGGVAEDQIIGGPPDKDFDWEHWFGHVKVEAGLRFWLQQYKPKPGKPAGFGSAPERSLANTTKTTTVKSNCETCAVGGGSTLGSLLKAQGSFLTSKPTLPWLNKHVKIWSPA